MPVLMMGRTAICVARMVMAVAPVVVSPMPHGSFHYAPKHPGTPLESGSGEVDQAAKDTHKARIRAGAHWIVVILVVHWISVTLLVHRLASTMDGAPACP